MFTRFLSRRDGHKRAERRFRDVGNEIDTVAQQVSRRHRILAARMKDVAVNKPTEFMQALQIEKPTEKVAQIDRLIGKGVRLTLSDEVAPHLDQLLASAAEYGWANEARRSH